VVSCYVGRNKPRAVGLGCIGPGKEKSYVGIWNSDIGEDEVKMFLLAWGGVSHEIDYVPELDKVERWRGRPLGWRDVHDVTVR
jgi:hypothetical protein